MQNPPERARRIAEILEAVRALPKAGAELATACLLAENGFLEPDFYLASYPDIVCAEVDPALHYLRFGWKEARSPASWCDGDELARLLRDNPDLPKGSFAAFLASWLRAIPAPVDAAGGAIASHPPPSNSRKTPDTATSKGQPAQVAASVLPKAKLRILRQGSIHAFYNRQMHVDWTLTNMCNYKCSYCWGQKPLDRSKFTPFAKMKKAVDHLAELARPSYKLTLSGGEPTTHPHFFELIEYIAVTLRKRLNYILIISNGSRQGELYKNLADMAKKININMLMSLHSEFVNVDHIMELIPLLTPGISITFNLMFNPAKRELVRQIGARLVELRKQYPFGMNVALLRMPPAFDKIDTRYNEADHAWRAQCLGGFAQARAAGPPGKSRHKFEESTFVEFERGNGREYLPTPYVERDNLLKSGFFNFNGMRCLMGLNTIAIKPNGMVIGAQCAQAKAKYNIFEENPFLRPDFTHFETCTLANCGCSANDSIPKFASEAESEDFLKAWRECRSNSGGTV